jgi:hypothetical protein
MNYSHVLQSMHDKINTLYQWTLKLAGSPTIAVFRKCEELRQPKRPASNPSELILPGQETHLQQPFWQLIYRNSLCLSNTPLATQYSHACFLPMSIVNCTTTSISSRFASSWRTTIHILASASVPVQCAAPHSHVIFALANCSINLFA